MKRENPRIKIYFKIIIIIIIISKLFFLVENQSFNQIDSNPISLSLLQGMINYIGQSKRFHVATGLPQWWPASEMQIEGNAECGASRFLIGAAEHQRSTEAPHPQPEP